MTTPLKLVQKFYAALSTGDISTIMTVLDPDLEWTEAEQTGRSMSSPFAHLWAARDGQLSRFVQYTDTAKVLEALRP